MRVSARRGNANVPGTLRAEIEGQWNGTPPPPSLWRGPAVACGRAWQMDRARPRRPYAPTAALPLSCCFYCWFSAWAICRGWRAAPAARHCAKARKAWHGLAPAGSRTALPAGILALLARPVAAFHAGYRPAVGRYSAPSVDRGRRRFLHLLLVPAYRRPWIPSCPAAHGGMMYTPRAFHPTGSVSCGCTDPDDRVHHLLWVVHGHHARRTAAVVGRVLQHRRIGRPGQDGGHVDIPLPAQAYLLIQRPSQAQHRRLAGRIRGVGYASGTTLSAEPTFTSVPWPCARNRRMAAWLP